MTRRAALCVAPAGEMSHSENRSTKTNNMIALIKTVHTLIWAIMATAIFYIGYCVAQMKFEIPFYIALCLVLGEIVIILVNSWTCPLTNIARRYSEDTAPNFDIFLPRLIAQYNKEIFSVILVLILLLYVHNSVK
jgi:hypothetical protein